jgi:NAD(P)-dependent dehydrogenase (short-subunit alcohol dehydrogenase family)
MAEAALRNITDLSGRVAVVIGATSGLGRAIALGLADSGADVVPSGRREDLVGEMCEQVKSRGRRTFAKTVDVSTTASIEELRDGVVKHLGRVDILVNAAGRTLKKSVNETSDAEWAEIIDTNLMGMVRGCRSFYEPLRHSGRGRVINLGSLAAYAGFRYVGPYNAAKSAVLSLTQTLCIEWAPDNITVNALIPGVFPTELNAALLTGTDRGKELITRTPMKRFGRPEELVGAAVFLASDAASFVTGHGLAVDGGFLASAVNS